jgi:hypothetical protein
MTRNEPPETDPRRIRLWALARALNAHGYAVEMAETEPLLVVPSAAGAMVRIACHPRAACAGELWFACADGAPFAPADSAHLQDALVAVKGQLASHANG